MAKESKSCREEVREGIRVFAYGFDAAGFETPREPTRLANIGRIEFIQFDDATSLDSADGVIIPQGIFESTERSANGFHTRVRVHRDLLLERDRQISNLIREGKWVCFLVDEIVDRVSGLTPQDIRDTDLCKRFLNLFGVQRNRVGGITVSDVKANEFISYIYEYGVAKTVLKFPRKQFESRVIAKAGNDVVGVEFHSQYFFLPFHTTKRDPATATSIVRVVAQAIFDYRQKRIVEIPAWVDEFQFSSEESLRSQISALREQANRLQNQLQSWRGYKAILTTSGDILKNRLVRILEDFFLLEVDPIDENREDAKILDEGGKILAMIETKGTKRGIKREYINQVDSHRERNELPTSIPGVLFINNEMSIAGIDKRLETKVPDDQIKHAKTLNILIVRTIDLLFLTRHLENNPDRQAELMRLLLSSGGWLRADSEGYGVVSE